MEEQKTEIQTPLAHAGQNQETPSQHKPSGFKSKLPLIIIAVLLVLVGIFGGYFILNQMKQTVPTPTPDQKACSQEAKICPDGSGVGRTGPNCEFAKCPDTPASPSSAETADWKTYANSTYGFSFQYPDGVIMEDKSVPGIAQVILAAQGFRETNIYASRNDLSEYYLDTAPSGEIKIGGLTGKKYYLPDGYCDGPTCSSPILAVAIVKNGIKYVFSTFVEKGDDSFTNLENQILSTFKFN